MSTLKVNNIGKTTGSTQDTMEGFAKAWLKTNGSGTPTVGDSFNIASIVDNGVGELTANYSNSFSSANYGGGAQPVTAAFAAMIQALSISTGSIHTKIHSDSAGGADGDRQLVEHGDLA